MRFTECGNDTTHTTDDITYTTGEHVVLKLWGLLRFASEGEASWPEGVWREHEAVFGFLQLTGRCGLCLARGVREHNEEVFAAVVQQDDDVEVVL